MLNCANPKCRKPAPVEGHLCQDCLIALAEKLQQAIGLKEDPTTRHCEVCHAVYAIDEARVRRALTTCDPEHQQAAKLCWVCARLYRSVRSEAPENVITPDQIL